MTISFRAALMVSTAVSALALRSDAHRAVPVAAVPILVNLTATPTSVLGGSPVALVVQLSEPAAIGGFAVTLRSSATVITVPTTVTVPQGAATLTVTATSAPVAASTLATITASTSDGTRKTVDVRVLPPTVTTVAVSPASVVGGQPSAATITINGPAPATGMVVRLSSNSVALVVPAAVTVPAGLKSIKANLTTSTVTTTATATVTATAGVSATGTLTITPGPPRIVSMSVVPNVVSNSQASVTVTFSRALDTLTSIRIVSGDTLATLKFITGSAVAGQTSRIITFTPKAVNANRTVTLATALNGDSVRATTTVAPMTIDLHLSADSVIGTGTSTATVTLNAAPANPMALLVTSNQSSAVVPSSFTAGSGGSSQGTFTISTFAVTADVHASIAVKLQPAFGTAADTSVLTVIPATITSFTASPDSILLPDAEPSFRTLTGHITYAIPAPAGGVIIALSSSAPMTSMPTTVLIPAGSSQATFTAVVSDNAQAGQYALHGITQNGRSAQGPFRVARRPPAPEVSSIVIPETQALGGTAVSGTVTLNAPAGGLTTVRLTAPTIPGGIPSVTFQPAEIPIAEGQTTGTFTATGTSVATATPRPITAQRFTNGIGGSTSRRDTLTVLPGSITSFTMPQSTLFSGQQATGTASLSTPRGSVPVAATISDTTVATVSALSSPSAATTVSVSVTARAVAAPATATITVTYAGSTQSATVTVQPASRLASVVLPSNPILPLAFPATVSLTGPAPSGGAIVSIVGLAAQGIANGSSLSQSTVTIPAGQSSTTFQMSPLSPRDLSLIESVMASYTPAGNPEVLGDSRVDSVEIQKLILDGGAPPGGAVAATLRSGDTLTVTVRTNLPAPAGGLTLTATSAQPAAATITPSLTIPAGQNSATFRIVAQTVAASTQFQARVDAVPTLSSLIIFLTVNP